MSYSVLLGHDHPEIHETAQQLVEDAFAPFMDHSAVIDKYWRYLSTRWPKWQFVLADSDNTPVVLGNCFPLRHDPEASTLPDGGVEWALEEAVRQSDNNITPTVACAFQIIISDRARGQGLSYRSIDVMKQICRGYGVDVLFAPVRPNRKEQYPTMPIEEYVAWLRDDGLPMDDWMRVHVKMGGEMLNICHRSFVVDGSLDQWKEWTGRWFESDGEYTVDGALVPIRVKDGRGLYVEPNVWFRHRI